MLLANITVAKKILRHFPSVSCLRRHPAPSRRQFDGLLAAARAVGVEISVRSRSAATQRGHAAATRARAAPTAAAALLWH